MPYDSLPLSKKLNDVLRWGDHRARTYSPSCTVIFTPHIHSHSPHPPTRTHAHTFTQCLSLPLSLSLVLTHTLIQTQTHTHTLTDSNSISISHQYILSYSYSLSFLYIHIHTHTHSQKEKEREFRWHSKSRHVDSKLDILLHLAIYPSIHQKVRKLFKSSKKTGANPIKHCLVLKRLKLSPSVIL